MAVNSGFSFDAQDKFITWPGLDGSMDWWVLCHSPGGSDF